ncbi:GAF domain-containing protein [Myroides odoratimimus]|uniref:GAF domain-containing protein n=1 Tax=Myroides odoratimimus TaxID=76832 RepID=UPI001CE15A94|nr:GAF domain-containing protein [Myroides odoratimimus]MCA4791704.1 GAF domain-containing protein [Myroides odoratimimus]MCA4818965.1 GAF domain-containing protein [Myroides odoratimimus]MDM1057610.1 GAF domain-containing protein [Myroides odoratimimus]MDM1091840.1 GAF domain-containing protein [Myroides odoratimimus]MDM1399281.1 GAF domain-containing protein [Myroides odoratimimus]
MNNLYQELLVAAKAILESSVLDRTEKLQQVCILLNEKIAYYDWVGFYFAVPEERVLHLGPYSGPETDHTVIPFGKGICGQVAVSNETFLVEDVTAQDNYIACSFTVKSEIVVPLFVDGVNIGQIDIDSNTINAFTAEDQSFLELLNVEIAKLFI